MKVKILLLGNISKLLATALCCLQLTMIPVHGGIMAPSEAIRAHLFFADVDGTMCPVVGVRTVDRIEVILPDKERKVVDFKTVKYANKELPPAGRVTVITSEGNSLSGTEVNGDWVTNFAESNFFIKLVADRPIKDVYAVILFQNNKANGREFITMGSVGDLPAGEIVRRNVFIRNVAVKDRMRYQLELYSNGFPIEQYRLKTVATMPYTHGLLIPWEARLEQFLGIAKADKRNEPPNPFQIGFSKATQSACEASGLEQIRMTLMVQEDGTVELEKADERLNSEQLALFRTDIADWRFFPEVVKGRPKSKLVTIPLKF